MTWGKAAAPTGGDMDVEVRNLVGVTLGEGRMLDSVAMGIQRFDQVVFPFMYGCWIIQIRHITVRKIDGGADMTFLVAPRDD
jgi:hypothetical protein